MAGGWGDRDAGEHAVALLRRAEREPGGATDHELHSHLGFLEQVSGHPEEAAQEYERGISADPYDSLALGDLALIRAKQQPVLSR